jgi:cytochrome P450
MRLTSSGARREAAVCPALTDLPSPPCIPILRHTLPLRSHDFLSSLERWAHVHGPTYFVRSIHKSFVVTCDPSLIRQALTSRPDAFRRDSRLAPVFEQLGIAGLYTAEGSAWQSQRRLAEATLTKDRLRHGYFVLAPAARRLYQHWRRAAECSSVVDILDDFKRFALDATAALSFGHQLDSFGVDRHEVMPHLERLFPTVARRVEALVPWWRVAPTRRDRDVREGLVALRQWVTPLVAAARRSISDSSRQGQPANYLEALAGEDGMSDSQLFANSVTMLLAGTETTASTLAWAVHHLLDEPQALQNLSSELEGVLGEDIIPESLEAASHLRYAGAVVMETMRLRPAGPALFLEARDDSRLGPFRLPPGTGVILLLRVPAMDPAHFDNPTSFIPERWMQRQSMHTRTAYTPFGFGSRICPGRSLAIIEMQVALATLCRNFSLERVGRTDEVVERLAFTLSPKRVQIRLHHLKHQVT